MPVNMNDLNERLAALESALGSARAEIADLRVSRTKHRLGTAALIGMAAMASVMTSSFGWGVTHAQEYGHAVSAPFIVRDSSGKTILRVDEGEGLNQLALLNPDGKGVAALVADGSGGLVIAAGSDGKTRASIGLSDAGDGGLALWDSDGMPIADIVKGSQGGRGLGVYDSGGALKVEVATQAMNDAAIIRVKSAEQPLAAMLFVDNNNSGLFVKDPVTGARISTVGLDSPEPGADGSLTPARAGLTIFSTEGKPIVEANQNPGGSGSLIVRDKTDSKLGAVLGVGAEGPAMVLYAPGGAQRVELAVVNGKPALDMQNSANKQLVEIAEGPAGAGRLQLGDVSGNTTVEAGTLPNGHGIVRVYPWESNSPAMFLGMPGTYIVGHEHGGGQ